MGLTQIIIAALDRNKGKEIEKIMEYYRQDYTWEQLEKPKYFDTYCNKVQRTYNQ